MKIVTPYGRSHATIRRVLSLKPQLVEQREIADFARGDGLTDTAPVLTRVEDFAALLRAGEDEAMSQALRRSETIGRPLGDDTFLERINAALGRDPRPAKRGPRKKLNALSP